MGTSCYLKYDSFFDSLTGKFVSFITLQHKNDKSNTCTCVAMLHYGGMGHLAIFSRMTGF